MQLRRSALVMGALILSVAPLSACSWASERPYTPAAGANNQDGSVDVLGAVIVSANDGSGTFHSSLVNNAATDDATLTAIEGEGITFASPSAAAIPARGILKLGEGQGITATGEPIKAGTFLVLTLTFDGADAVKIQVPVVPDTDEFEGLDQS